MVNFNRKLHRGLVTVTVVGLSLVAADRVAADAAEGDRGVDQIDFIWAPASPEIGELVLFEVTGVAAADIERASWEFGGIGCDGSTGFVCTPSVVLCDVAAFRYASAGTKTVTVTVTVGGVQQPPITHLVTIQATGGCSGPGGAGLTFEPPAPEIGEAVLFTVTGFAGPIRVLWDFGEDGCDGYPQFQTCDPVFGMCQQMAFRFASSGDKNVAVVVENPITGAVLDTANLVMGIGTAGSCGGVSYERYVLQSFHAPGAGGSVFRHEMELFNPDAADALIRVDWLPRASDNTVPPLSANIPVPSQSAVRFGNVLDEIFGLAEAVGSLRLAAIPASIQLSNRGLNTGSAGSIGWTIPSGAPSAGLGPGEVGTIIHLSETAELRTNVGCNNWSADPVAVNLDLVDTGGTVLDTVAMVVQPYSDTQINRVFQSFMPVEGSVHVGHSHPGGLVSCVGMVGFNTTSDFRSEPMQRAPDPGLTYLLPRAVHFADATTDLALFAPAGPAAARLDFLPTAQDNTSYVFASFTLSDREELRLPAVLDTVFSAGGTGSLRVVATSGAVLVSAAERRNVPGAERLRSARVRPLAEQVPAYRPAAIIHLTESSEHRTDIGIANTSALTIQVTVELRDALGDRLGTRNVNLLPFSHYEIEGAFAAVGHPDVADGIARVFTPTPGGSFFAYAVVTELDTRDSFEMSAELMPAALFANGFETGDLSRWHSTLP